MIAQNIVVLKTEITKIKTLSVTVTAQNTVVMNKVMTGTQMHYAHAIAKSNAVILME